MFERQLSHDLMTGSRKRNEGIERLKKEHMKGMTDGESGEEKDFRKKRNQEELVNSIKSIVNKFCYTSKNKGGDAFLEYANVPRSEWHERWFWKGKVSVEIFFFFVDHSMMISEPCKDLRRRVLSI